MTNLKIKLRLTERAKCLDVQCKNTHEDQSDYPSLKYLRLSRACIWEQFSFDMDFTRGWVADCNTRVELDAEKEEPVLEV